MYIDTQKAQKYGLLILRILGSNFAQIILLIEYTFVPLHLEKGLYYFGF